MTLLPPGVKVHLAFGYTDMRKGMDGLALLVQEVLQADPFSATSSSSADARPTSSRSSSGTEPAYACSPKRLEHGVFLWPSNIEAGRTLALTSTQLSALIEGIDWRSPERQWRPAVAG